MRNLALIYEEESFEVLVYSLSYKKYTLDDWIENNRWKNDTVIGVYISDSNGNSCVLSCWDYSQYGYEYRIRVADFTGMVSYSSLEDAIQCFSGFEDTNLINEQDLNRTAARVASETIPPSGGDYNHYLPSAGELNLVLNNIDKVNEIIEYIGGDIIETNSGYWSSTRCDSSTSWCFFYGSIMAKAVNSYQKVRPFIPV